jgi:hypothetical protein
MRKLSEVRGLSTGRRRASRYTALPKYYFDKGVGAFAKILNGFAFFKRAPSGGKASTDLALFCRLGEAFEVVKPSRRKASGSGSLPRCRSVRESARLIELVCKGV